MGGGTQTSEEAVEGNLGSEREDHPEACFDKTRSGRKQKPGRKRKVRAEEPTALIELIALTVAHWFPDLNRWIASLQDPRDPKRIYYELPHLVWLGLLMLVGGMRSRHHLGCVSDTALFLANLLQFSGSEAEWVAHPDTLDYLLQRMDPKEFGVLQARCMRRLIRSKALDRFRLGGEFLVAVDATGQRSFLEKHCDQCLHQTHQNGTEVWFHQMLEARLITSSGMVFSMANAPVQNEQEEYEKQDCELKAFYRLAPTLKEKFPKLRICLLLDSLYAGEPTMSLCRELGWSYFMVFQKGSIPNLWKRAMDQIERSPANNLVFRPDAKTKQVIRWATGLKHGEETVHILTCEETIESEPDVHRWVWITDHRPNKANAAAMVNKGARLRWKTENEGFNTQKNGELALEHDYGSKGNALHGYYMLAQTAHMIQQLVAHGDLMRKLTKTTAQVITTSVLGYYSTMRNLCERLRESMRRDTLSALCTTSFPKSIQIRFDSS